MERNEIFRIYGTNYKEMTIRLLEAVNLSEEIIQQTRYRKETGQFPHAGNDEPLIAIKPNLVSPTPAMYGATTHPEIVEGIIEYLQKNGFSRIRICEGSWVGDKTEDAFEYCGYNQLAAKYNAELFDTQKDGSMQVHNGMDLRVCRCLQDIDFLINVPVLKGHCQTRITCALKNMKGLIPNSEKRRFHSLGLHKPIAHLNSVIHQDFIVVDHICGDPNFEDGGNPLVRNCIMTAKDPVLVDTLACRLLGYEPEEVEYICLAEALQIGSTDLDAAKIRTISDPSAPYPVPEEECFISEAENHREAFPAASTGQIHRLLELNYAVDEIESCSACYSSLIGALDRLEKEGLLKELTETRALRFCIGQGYRDLSEETLPERSGGSVTSACSSAVPRIGIGSCTSGFQKNIPGCPPSEDDIYQYLIREITETGPAGRS